MCSRVHSHSHSHSIWHFGFVVASYCRFSCCLFTRLQPHLIPFRFISFHIVFIFSLSLSASLSIFLFLAASVREPCASDDVCFPFLMSFVFIASFSISFAQVLALKNHYLFLYHLFCHIIIFLFDCIFMACARARFFPLCVHAYVRVHSTMYNNTF